MQVSVALPGSWYSTLVRRQMKILVASVSRVAMRLLVRVEYCRLKWVAVIVVWVEHWLCRQEVVLPIPAALYLYRQEQERQGAAACFPFAPQTPARLGQVESSPSALVRQAMAIQATFGWHLVLQLTAVAGEFLYRLEVAQAALAACFRRHRVGASSIRVALSTSPVARVRQRAVVC
jgi:hypothetical protein